MPGKTQARRREHVLPSFELFWRAIVQRRVQPLNVIELVDKLGDLSL